MEWISITHRLPVMECQKYEVLVASKSQILRNKTNDTIIVSFATGKYYGHHRWTIYSLGSSYAAGETDNLMVTHWRKIGNIPEGYNYLA